MTITTRSIRFIAALVLLQTLVALPVRADESAPLYSINAQTYHLTLTGKVETLGRPAANTEVHFNLVTSRQDSIKSVAQTREDGSYTIQVAFTGYSMDQVDWKVSTANSNVVEEGRQILAEDTEIQITRPVSVALGAMDINIL